MADGYVIEIANIRPVNNKSSVAVQDLTTNPVMLNKVMHSTKITFADVVLVPGSWGNIKEVHITEVISSGALSSLPFRLYLFDELDTTLTNDADLAFTGSNDESNIIQVIDLQDSYKPIIKDVSQMMIHECDKPFKAKANTTDIYGVLLPLDGAVLGGGITLTVKLITDQH